MRLKRGFTLVEMLVATILLGLGIFAAIGAINVSVQATGGADFYQNAGLLAQRQINQLETNPESIAPGEQRGDFGGEHPGYRWRQRITSSEYPSLYQVTITIEQGADERPRSREFTTYLRYDPKQDAAEREEREKKRNETNDKSGGGQANAPSGR